MKVGDKVKVLGGYGGAFCGRLGVVTELSDGWCMVTTRKGLPEHTGDSDLPDDDFHLCFLKSQVLVPIQHPTTGTLAELGVKPGDVVEFVEERRNPYGYTYPTDETTVLGRGLVHGINPERDDAIWRIVSRASDLSKLDYTPINVEKPIYEVEADTRPLECFQSGPVITETVTRKRIVPGVYGHIWIDWVVDGIVCLGLRNNALKKMDTVALSRADLIAARDILSQLVDAIAPQA